MKPTLLVLAAGMGSRYGGLKQMDPVGPNQETLLDYSIYDAVEAGFGKAVFVIRPDFAEAFMRNLGARFEKKIAVAYAFQELHKTPPWFKVPENRQKPWGTGHAVLMAKDLIDEPFAMINADDFYGRQGFQQMSRTLQGLPKGELSSYAMVGYTLESTLSEHGTVSRGICTVDRGGSLLKVVERTKIEKTGTGARDQTSGALFTGDETVSMNFFGFTRSVFGHLERAFETFLKDESKLATGELFVPGVVDQLIQDGTATVKVVRSPDAWFGITYREDQPQVARGIAALIQAGRYPSRLRD